MTKKSDPGYGCLFWILIILVILFSCTKQDYSYLNTDRRVKMIRVSKWFELDWTFRDSTIQGVAYNPALLPVRDTIIFSVTCPISGIEIRYYKEIKP